jgi:hypothetical protein
MRWEKPRLVDLADRHNALNAVGFSSPNPPIDTIGSTCQDGCAHAEFCMVGGVASLIKTNVHVNPFP